MTTTFERLLPRVIDNAYRGTKTALVILALVAALKLAMGLNSIFNGAVVLATADGVPLATYPAAAAQTIVAFFALWALGQLLLALLALMTLVRYRSMTPLVFALLIAEHLGRKLILQFLPIARSATAPASAINLILIAVLVLGLVLSLIHRRPDRAEGEGAHAAASPR